MTETKIDLTTLFFSISSAGFMALGPTPDLALAKQNIDLLELMKEKTTGNLTQDESKLLDHLLFEIRIKFVEAQKKGEKK